MKYADMHIHSLYSDGSHSPAEIVRRAKAGGVGLISVCDHNVVQGTLEAAPLAQAAGLAYIPGVEIDAIHEGADIHILCYGADLSNGPLLARIRHARARLDGMSTELLRRMLPEHPRLSMEDYEIFAHDSSLGGWKMLQYLRARGLTRELHDGFGFYERYGVTYAEAGFDGLETIVSAIHAAGGRAVLAHPGVVFPNEYLSEFERHVQRALDAGMDGVECHYPRHTPAITRRCLEICRARGLMITAGSDCHGAFNQNQIGQTRTPISKLKIGSLA